MSDVSTTVNAGTTSSLFASMPTWAYVLIAIALVAIGIYLGYKRVNTPQFVIKQLRKRNRKELKKQGVEGNEATHDLDELLDAVQAYATQNEMTGAQMGQLLAPMNQKEKMKSANDFYHSMSYIAKSINNPVLAKQFSNKAKQVKSSSALMAGLLKRAGI